jgi:nucleotide-binding universal stress UspA family protein
LSTLESIQKAFNSQAAGGKQVSVADLIVLGTHAQTRLERFFMGSVAEHVVNRCSVSVLVVPERMEK